MSLRHLEDLPITDFIDCLTNIDKFVMSEKIDGSELCFGFDENNKFFTSREYKSGKRYYNDSDWPKLFWTTGFRSAHNYLKDFAHVFHNYIKPGQLIEVEVLFGNLPNTVDYDLEGINRIVFLRGINCNIDFTELHKELGYRPKHLWLKDVPVTHDAWTIETDICQLHSWQIATIPATKAKELSLKVKCMLDGLKYYTSGDILSVAQTRITNKNREYILSIRGTIQTYKDQIKNQLIEELVTSAKSKFSSAFSQTSWIEGYVFRNIETGFQFKLVDKNKFTKINKEKHEYTEHLRNVFWKGWQKYLSAAFGHNKVDKTVLHTFNDIHELYISLSTEHYIRPRELSQPKIIGALKCLRYNLETEQMCWLLKNETNDRVRQEFASLNARLLNMSMEFAQASCIEHMLEVALFETISLPHSKSVSGTVKVNRKQIDDVCFYIWQLLRVEDIELARLGSASFAKTCGDIDIGIDKNVLSLNQVETILNENHYPFTTSNNLNIIHTRLPLDRSYEKYAQVDLIFTDNLPWLKFWYRGRTINSQYKGLYRNALLRAIAGSTNMTLQEVGDNEIYYRAGWVGVPTSGLEYQIKERPIGQKGQRLKTFSKTEVLGIINEPNRVVANIFQTYRVTPNDVLDFESTWQMVLKHKTPAEIRLIIQIMKKILTEFKYKVPKELIIYDNNIHPRS